MNKMYFVFF